MSEAAAPVASRSGTAAGARSSRASRSDERTWRTADRAVRLGKKHGAHAVEYKGVRYILKSEEKPEVTHPGGNATGEQARRRHVEPARAQAGEPRKLNHAQRKSAKRLKEVIEAQSAQTGTTEESRALATIAAETLAPVDTDARMADGALAAAEGERRGRKRAAGESPPPAPQPSASAQESPGVMAPPPPSQCKPCRKFVDTYLDTVLEDHFENSCKCVVKPNFEYRWAVPKGGQERPAEPAGKRGPGLT